MLTLLCSDRVAKKKTKSILGFLVLACTYEQTHGCKLALTHEPSQISMWVKFDPPVRV